MQSSLAYCNARPTIRHELPDCSISFVQDYALAVAEFEMADAKAQREAAEAATLRRKAEQLEGQAIELAEKWTGVQNRNRLLFPLLWDCTASAGQQSPVWSSAAV